MILNFLFFYFATKETCLFKPIMPYSSPTLENGAAAENLDKHF